MASDEEQRPFPEDILTEIFSRLPMKSLLHIKTVCKQWHFIISSSDFIRKHYHHESNHTRLLVYWSEDVAIRSEDRVSDGLDGARVHQHSFTLFQDESLERWEELNHINLPGVIRCPVDIQGPYKGIFCVRNTDSKMALWNPATQRLRPLPAPPFNIFEFGFGVDPFTDEFKIAVVEISDHSWKCPSGCFGINSSRCNSWRDFENISLLEPNSSVFYSEWSSAFLNGSYYWVKCRSSGIYVLLAFDMYNEVFEEIEMPFKSFGQLTSHNDSLAMLYYDAFTREIDIWLMKVKGSWTRHMMVFLPVEFDWPIGLWKTHQIFLVFQTEENSCSSDQKMLFFYDLNSNVYTCLRVDKQESTHSDFGIYHYRESLTSVKGGPGLDFEDYDAQSAVSMDFFLDRRVDSSLLP